MQTGELMFSQTHEWVRKENDVATIGITEFAAKQLSDLVYIDLPKAGQSIKAGEPFGEVESVKAVSDLNAPISGEVTETNETVLSNLDPVTKDPYGTGWLIKVKISNTEDLKKLMPKEEYNKLCASEN